MNTGTKWTLATVGVVTVLTSLTVYNDNYSTDAPAPTTVSPVSSTMTDSQRRISDKISGAMNGSISREDLGLPTYEEGTR